MSRWYRAYEGTVTDAKLGEVALVAECSRSVAIAAWHCVLESAASVNDGGRFDATLRRVAVILGEPVSTIETVFAELESLGMIKNSVVCAWRARQYESDSSTERSRKYREKLRKNGGGNVGDDDATPMQRCATPPYTETDTETEVVVANATTPRVRASAVRGSRIPPDWTPEKPIPASVIELSAQWPPGRIERELDGFRDYWTSRTRDASKADWDRAWWNRIRDQHDRVMKENRNGRQLDNAGSGLRGNRPDPCLELLRQSRAELEAEADCSGQDSEHRSGTWPALPAVGAG